MARNISHGRGGAGNIYSSETRTTPQDLVTPTIKQEVYTTGRGGSGNMVHNDPDRPEIARESQDVEAPPRRVQEGAPHHTGRGGAANQYIPTAEEERKAREEEEQLRRVITSKSVREPRDIEEGNANAERGRSLPSS
ncbi:hypothetical protein BJX68DRAFT_265232 [Aspergillus pseudodeflectus]|uniref:Uncharacterized protein n=1 Tax=Aspergillus pseudodeflectus TaxID=176178 RepID=A0ABR4KP20_9EURO